MNFRVNAGKPGTLRNAEGLTRKEVIADTVSPSHAPVLLKACTCDRRRRSPF